MNIKELKELAQRLFSNRATFMTLLQEIADNFYPQRADFTFRRQFGEEYADHLITSYPVMVTRDLGNQLGTMLRPVAEDWFNMGLIDYEPDTEGKQYLEWVTKRMRRAMYDKRSMFTRATKEGDHDFAAFGQCVLSVRPARDGSHLLFMNYHIRDCAWDENENGQIGFFVRKWKAKKRELVRLFRDVHKDVYKEAKEHPHQEVECYHIFCDADYYSENANGRPYWSIYIDCEHDHVMEATPMWDFDYIVPRWQTVSGSQYAFSPATIVALPDARLMQSMALSLLEAGEKAVNPPMVATADTVKSDVSIYAGGITWVDKEYDERLGDALRPISQDFRGLPYGFEMQVDQRQMLRSAFYLDKLGLPINAPEMTAYEVGQRVQQYIREAMPIFEPMEYEYNGQLCESIYRRMLRMGGFGNPAYNMPRSLSNRDYQFNFESPMHDAIEQKKGQKLLEAKQLIAEAVSMDQAAIYTLDAKKALRDALHGIKVDAAWLRTESTVKQMEQSEQDKMAAQEKLAEMEQSSQIAANLKQAQGM